MGAPAIRREMVVAILGSSLTTGRLSGNWVPQLTREACAYPEARGPIRILDLGKGGRTSLDGLAQAPLITGLRPTHILTEGYGINDCFNTGSGPAVSPATHIADIQSFVNQWLAGIPGVNITLQTMSSVSYYQTARTALAAYYADELATATGLGISTLDNYSGVAGGPAGGWPKPLNGLLTDGVFLDPYGPPSGYSLWDYPVAFDPTKTNANLALSGGVNQIATSIASINSPARSLTGAPVGVGAGKFYFGWRQTGDPAFTVAGTSVGVQTATGSLGNGKFIGSDVDSWGYANNGELRNSGGSVPYGPSWGIGDFIGVCFDGTHLYFAKNGVYVGNPVAGTGGVNVYSGPDPSGPLFPAVSLSTTDSGDFVTLFGDGLHPNWAGAVDTYLYPNIVAWLRAKMLAFWP